MDGVLTKTATVHAAAWKQAFDEFLQEWGHHHPDADTRPFDVDGDYDSYVDGKTRDDGTRDFLESRHIHLPEGDPDDPPGKATVHGVGNRKNAILLERLEHDGVETFDDAVRYVRAVRDGGLPCAVVSSSANTTEVLEAAGIHDLFDAQVDGNVIAKRGLAGKPAPDTYLAGADALGLTADQAAVFEDAIAGVEAGRAGHFALVVGVDRVGQSAALRQHGADVVVTDLGQLLDQS
jgi:beta-phosphoglucomutase family hydrolase